MTSKKEYANSDKNPVTTIELYGEVIEDYSLQDLKKQAKDIQLNSDLILKIASPGGSVLEGLNIMVWLDNLRTEMGVHVTTVVTANAYSIASLIMLAADMRLISRHGKVMVHNPMIPILEYANANELEAQAIELRESNKDFLDTIIASCMDYIKPLQDLTKTR